jgi:hypothetical protein
MGAASGPHHLHTIYRIKHEIANHKRYKIMSNQPMIYQIRLKGHIASHRRRSFEDLTLTMEENGDTLLTGVVTDQAALHGLLRKVRDLGLPLLEVTHIQPRQADGADGKQ